MRRSKRTTNGRKEEGGGNDMTRDQCTAEEYRAGVCPRLLHTPCATLAKERERVGRKYMIPMTTLIRASQVDRIGGKEREGVKDQPQRR